MLDQETAVVFAVLMGLFGLTVVPFAVPAVQFSDPGPTATATPSPTPREGKSAPAGVTPGTPSPTPPTSSTATTTAESTRSPSATPTLREPTVDCQPIASGGLPDAYPVTLNGTTVTGRDVSVAVIDPSGFDLDDPRIAEAVAATRSFRARAEDDIANDGANQHGTESAALVSSVAPDASLHLANFQKAVDFTRAVEWAVERDVDVIVAPVAFYAKPNDGTAPVSQAVMAATEAGIPVVAPTGNVATHHWEGTYDGDTWVEFAPNDTRLYLEGSDRPVQAWLWWNETATSGPNEFRLVLYRDTADGVEQIATSEDYPVGPVGTNQVLFEKIRTNNLLSKSIGNGTYFLRIRGPPGVPHRVELVTTAHGLEASVARGSLMAPATARGHVIAVGATGPDGKRVLETSSRGPTNDGRLGIDLVAPGTVASAGGRTFTGTSAAAAYTGGVVALLAQVEPGLTAAEAEAVLQATADGERAGAGPLVQGHGVIDPRAALGCLAGNGSEGT